MYQVIFFRQKSLWENKILVFFFFVYNWEFENIFLKNKYNIFEKIIYNLIIHIKTYIYNPLYSIYTKFN